MGYIVNVPGFKYLIIVKAGHVHNMLHVQLAPSILSRTDPVHVLSKFVVTYQRLQL